MNILTAEKCREQIDDCIALKERGYLSINGEYKLQALEIALPILEQQERGEVCPAGYRLVPEKLSDEMLRRIVPNMAHSLPISHDEYDYHGRNERFIKWVWARLLELSEAVIPERATNQNGEQ